MTPDLSRASKNRPVHVGRYDVTGLIGRGGMGAVYRAIDRADGSEVALKTLTNLSPDSLLRFKNEFRSVADVSHPNLVPLYELGCESGLWFFTMEHIAGVDFLEWIRGPSGTARTASASPAITPGSDDPTRPARHGSADRASRSEPAPAPVTDIVKLRRALAQLVRGVSALHEASLLHLDIKPSNVLVDARGRVVLLDFGLVRPLDDAALDELAHDRKVLGTPAWMAPEQFARERIGEAADWYAVGLMLYHALAGVPAFSRADPAATLHAKRHVPPVPPAQLVAGIPEDLSALAASLIRAEPDSRPTGPALLEIVSGEPAAVRATRVAAHVDLVGRESERATLLQALERAERGGAAIALISGPSGMGKTAIVDTFLENARIRRGAIVLRGRCYERETVPYKAFDGLVDELSLWLSAHPSALKELPAWTSPLSCAFPVLSTVPAIVAHLEAGARARLHFSPVELRRRALRALRALFASLSRDRPVVLRIDDLQWLDADSAATIDELLTPSLPKGLVLVLVYRAEDAALLPAFLPKSIGTQVAKAAEKKDGDVDIARLHVGPLSQHDAERLAAATLDELRAPSSGLSVAIAKEAAGVPLFVKELARVAAEDRETGTDGAGAIGVSLDELLVRRIRSLPEIERRLLEVLAVATNPVPIATLLPAAAVETGGQRALWALRRRAFVRSTGTSHDGEAPAEESVEVFHDRTRQSLLRDMTPDQTAANHVALGWAFAVRARSRSQTASLFDAVRHLNSGHAKLGPREQHEAARLNLTAGLNARRAAAFPLAFDCFHAGAALLGDAGWSEQYDLALALHTGAAEAAYLSGDWAHLDEHISIVTGRAKNFSDQLSVWEVRIDAAIGNGGYVEALDKAAEALRLVAVDLPCDPGEAEIAIELERTMRALEGPGPGGFTRQPIAQTPEAIFAMRVESRILSAAYFARPKLLPILACRIVATSVEHGPCAATSHALAVYGIVLSSLGHYHDAHRCGLAALELLDRFHDASQDARTRHVVHNLVGVWTVPLASTLDSLRRVIEIGQETGDLEYAGYAAHAYTHNALYAGRELESLLTEALDFEAFMRGHGHVNALHVHVPFIQLLRALTGRLRDPASLSGDGFDEDAALRAARDAGSRSGQFIVHFSKGLVRYHFGSRAAASTCFEEARPFLDGVASTWHLPIFHQHAALALFASGVADARADASLAALERLAEAGPMNFAHRVDLVRAARSEAAGDHAEALAALRRAAERAREGGWLWDLALAHELAGEREQAIDVYRRWGAAAKVAQLSR